MIARSKVVAGSVTILCHESQDVPPFQVGDVYLTADLGLGAAPHPRLSHNGHSALWKESAYQSFGWDFRAWPVSWWKCSAGAPNRTREGACAPHLRDEFRAPEEVDGTSSQRDDPTTSNAQVSRQSRMALARVERL
jgi:hypothetical protein